MRKRLVLLRELLSEEGTIWIQIDDEEQAYLKVLCDEVFGRENLFRKLEQLCMILLELISKIELS